LNAQAERERTRLAYGPPAALAVVITLGVLGIILDNVTFADGRVYTWAVPIADALMAASAVLGARSFRLAGGTTRIVLVTFFLAFVWYWADDVARRLPAIFAHGH
jgi:hypothetical protein